MIQYSNRCLLYDYNRKTKGGLYNIRDNKQTWQLNVGIQSNWKISVYSIWVHCANNRYHSTNNALFPWFPFSSEVILHSLPKRNHTKCDRFCFCTRNIIIIYHKNTIFKICFIMFFYTTTHFTETVAYTRGVGVRSS
jgi:hypothetical protein